VMICYCGCSTKYSVRICVLFKMVIQGCVVGTALAVCAVPYLEQTYRMDLVYYK